MYKKWLFRFLTWSNLGRLSGTINNSSLMQKIRGIKQPDRGKNSGYQNAVLDTRTNAWQLKPGKFLLQTKLNIFFAKRGWFYLGINWQGRWWLLPFLMSLNQEKGLPFWKLNFCQTQVTLLCRVVGPSPLLQGRHEVPCHDGPRGRAAGQPALILPRHMYKSGRHMPPMLPREHAQWQGTSLLLPTR